MAVEASSEYQLFIATAEAFLAKEGSLGHLRQLHAAGVEFERSWWKQAAELGWTALLVPEELGGGTVSGDAVKDLAALATLTGATVAPGPLHPVSVVLAGLVEAHNRDAHTKEIERLLTGDAVASWAVHEPGSSWRPSEPAVTAARSAGGFRLDGVKDCVEAGGQCDFFLVVARCDEGVGEFIVPADIDGVRVECDASIDLVKRYATVHFDGVQLPADSVVGDASQCGDLIARHVQIGLVLQCAEMVGILRTVFAMTTQWALDRNSFGRPLASYQALKHRFADLKTWLEACSAATDKAVTAVSARLPGADLTASIAKSYVAERASTIIQDCVQLHGGIGVTWEHDLHLYLRRAALYRSMFGSPEEHNLLVYRDLEVNRRETLGAQSA